MSHFHISPNSSHLRWSRHLKPALTVPSGAEVSFDLLDGGNNQVRPDNAATALADFDLARADPAFGPVHVEGAEPGDVLRVDVLALHHADYGWTAVFPGFGLLADEFVDPSAEGEQAVHIWDLSEKALLPERSSSAPTGSGSGSESTLRRAVFKPGISVPVRPFLGVVGVAPPPPPPPAPGSSSSDPDPPGLSTIPPYATSGGNMDCRDCSRVGSTLYLPVNVPGALFSCGDGHAAQGDGEVCGTAIETPMRATLRLTVEKRSSEGSEAKGLKMKKQLACPHYVNPRRTVEERDAEWASDRGEYAALGIDADPREAARMAVRGVIEWLVAEKQLTRTEAYMLASVAASLRMSEVVDMPNYAVSCALPLGVFDDEF